MSYSSKIRKNIIDSPTVPSGPCSTCTGSCTGNCGNSCKISVPCPALALARERVHSHVERLVRQLVHQHAHLSVTRAVQLDVEWGLVFSILHHKSRQPNSTIFLLCCRVGLFS